MTAAGREPASRGRAWEARRRRGYLLAALVLAGSLMAVWFYARSAGERERALASADFVAEANHRADLLRQRLLTYELTTLGGVSLFGSVERPSRAQWQDYVAGLRLQERSLGPLGLGYAAWLDPEGLAALQLEQRAAGEGRFKLQPRGVRGRYAPIVYLAPTGEGAAAMIGRDLYAEPALREALDAALEAGNARLSAPVALPGEDGSAEQAGLMMFAPVYGHRKPPATLDGRRADANGWVFVPFHARTLSQYALLPAQRDLHMRITDTGAGVRVYEDDGFEAVARAAGAFSHSTQLDLYGRRWAVEFTAPPQPLAGLGLSAQQGTLAIGVVLSLLLFAMVWVLARTQVRAERLADQMSESWRRSEVRFRAAMEYSGIGKALLDHGDRVVEANPALARILALPPEALKGRVFDSWFADVAPIPVAGSLTAVVRATRELRRPDGEHRHVQLTYAPVPGEIGSGVARLVQVEDVTDRLRAEARVRELNRTLEARVAERTRELEHANRELETFAYSVSHDLRAPLRTIEGFGRMLAERCGDVIDDTGRDHLRRIRAAAARMDGLIEALLTMSRLSRKELQYAPLDLSRMAEEIIADLRQGDPEREVEAVVQPGLRACGDPDLVRNLLQNLIGNAWKFTSRTPRARIEVGCEAHAGHDSVCFVRDNGAGFSQEYASKLFRPFQRLHGQEEFAGNGVGLASVRRVVERHGGEVWAEGHPGKGACFRFSLPDGPATGG
ncbi:MAG: PAS domain S-box protein [Gammaproteobacteria bacterium]|nr:PAS domain S-box protein [Gammaproteobacteria bacterium]